MPRIFDNIEQQLLPALRQTIELSERADFCVGYFNLRGWKQLDRYIGAWSNDDERGLRQLAAQIRTKKVVVKLFLRHPLHAKLYMLFRPQDPVSPSAAYQGSSNLTFAGLCKQGELNVDVLDHDACQKLARWFEDRWNEIDYVLAAHYGFTSEELDFIINYDIKYRMGRDAEEGDADAE
ncbi:MAG: NgoFVII family restriction endonuclease [Acidobacteria bacterium]|nr:NgoFVII family restriction endonuclease [Acidobacteriota bacterium]